MNSFATSVPKYVSCDNLVLQSDPVLNAFISYKRVCYCSKLNYSSQHLQKNTSTMEPLEGSCHCGRNKYVVIIPADTNEVARVFFDNSHNHRKKLPSEAVRCIR